MPPSRKRRKGERQNAKQIPEETWEKHKPDILDYYETQKLTLADVMVLMETKHDFTATKRQYVYHLGEKKWDVSKYHKHYGRSDHRQPRQPSTATARPSIRPQLPFTRLDTPQPELESFEDESFSSSHDDDSVLTLEDAKSTTDATQKTGVAIISSQAYAQQKSIADFFFAAQDDNTAFSRYLALFRCDVHLSAAERALLTVCLARCTPPFAQVPGFPAALDAITPPELDPESPAASFLNRMLQIHATTQPGDSAQAAHLTRPVMESILPDGHHLVPHLHRGLHLDLVTYHFLRYGLDLYTQSYISGHGPFHQQAVLDQFLAAAPARNSLITCIRACLAWCRAEARRAHFPSTDGPAAPRPSSPADRNWARGLHALACLWQRWQGSPASAAAWARPVPNALGISATELLFTVFWLCAPCEAGPLEGRIAAREGAGDGELEGMFLAKFTWMNHRVGVRPGDGAFKAQELRHIHSYVQSGA